MTQIEFEKCVEYIAAVKRLVDAPWLSQELDRIHSCEPTQRSHGLGYAPYYHEFHPLAFLIHQADEQLESCVQATQQILRLSYLGKNLSVLETAKSKGLDWKVRELTSSAKDRFYKAAYEVEIAAAYAEKGYTVEFVETKSDQKTRTPDIFIGFAGGLEVECKRKDWKRQRDARNADRWNLIVRRACGWTEYFGVNYAVHVTTERDPDGRDVAFILHRIRELLQGRREGTFRFPGKGVSISLKMLSDKDQEIEASGFLLAPPEEPEYFSTEWQDRRDEDGTRFHKNLRAFAFRSCELPDRIASILNSVRHARRQFSGNVPALVYVHVNMVGPQMTAEDLERLDSGIDSVLRSNSTISAVVISGEFFDEDELGPRYAHMRLTYKNRSPKHPLPPDFELY
jgi:hypothetical protein